MFFLQARIGRKYIVQRLSGYSQVKVLFLKCSPCQAYVDLNFFNPPWALIPIIPFAILPEQLGHALLGAFTLFSFAYVALQYDAKLLTLIFFLSMPLTLYNAVQLNVDWLMAWGLLLPPQLGLFFVLVKPQLGVFLAFYWFIEALKSGGAKHVFKVFAPVSIAFLLSFALFGNYFQRATVVFNESDKTFWPASIPVGLAILIISFRTKKAELSLSASLLLSPYIQPYSIPLAIFGLLPDQLMTNVFLFGLWFMVLDPNRGYIFERLIEPFVR